MSKDEVRKLLGGYATNTLSEEEQKVLFAAAMEDQELFDALADEESLRELLADPAVRSELRNSLEPRQSVWEQVIAWFRKPASLVLAGGLATAVIVTVAVNNITKTPEYRTVASREAPASPAEKDAAAIPAPTAATGSAAPAPRAKTKAREEGEADFRRRRESLADKEASPRRDTLARDENVALMAEARKSVDGAKTANEPAALPAAAPMPPPPPARKEAPKPGAAQESVMITAQAQALGKVRVAVLNFNSLQGAKQQPDAALTKDLASRLNQAPTQYSLVDQKEVDRVLAEKKLTDQPLDSQTAASVGRSLGADAVIVGNVSQQAQQRPMGAIGGFRQQQQARAKAEQKADQQNITAQVIDTRNAANQFTASADNMGRVAEQLAQFKVEGAVTDVTGTVLTINIGTPAGIKAGDRFQVVRVDQVLGQVRISSVSPTYSVGVFVGPVTPQAGDQVRRILD